MQKTGSGWILIVSLVASSAMAAQIGVQTAGDGAGEAVVAVYRGGVVTAAQMQTLVEERAQGRTPQNPEAFTLGVLGDYVAEEVLMEEAWSSEWIDRPAIQRAIQYRRELVGADVYLVQQQQQRVDPPTEKELRRRYRRDKEEFRLPERYSFRYIYIDRRDARTPEEQQARKAQAQDLLQRLRDGADFVTLAELYSDSDVKGRLLGPVAAGEISPTLDAPIRSATAGELLGVLESNQGYYIVEVDRVWPAGYAEFEDARALIRQKLVQEQRQEIATAVNRETLDECDGRVFEDVLSATLSASEPAVQAGTATWTYRELLDEAQVIGPAAVQQLEQEAADYAANRVLIRCLYNRALAADIVETATYHVQLNRVLTDLLKRIYLEQNIAALVQEPTPEIIATELRQNPTRYTTPELRRVWYLALPAEVERTLKPTERYRRIEQQRERLEQLLGPVRTGRQSFPEAVTAAIAAVTNATGGSLGLVARHQLANPTVREAAFQLKQSRAFSEPEADYENGFAFATYVEEIRPPEPMEEDVAEKVAREVILRQRTDKARVQVRSRLLEKGRFRVVVGWKAAVDAMFAGAD